MLSTTVRCLACALPALLPAAALAMPSDIREGACTNAVAGMYAVPAKSVALQPEKEVDGKWEIPGSVGTSVEGETRGFLCLFGADGTLMEVRITEPDRK